MVVGTVVSPGNVGPAVGGVGHKVVGLGVGGVGGVGGF